MAWDLLLAAFLRALHSRLESQISQLVVTDG
jgi:hypothetical protein